jgi:hypothetical protein
MRVRFGDLSTEEANEKARVCAAARQAWELVRTGDDDRACRLMDAIDPRLALSIQRDDSERVPHVELSAFEANAWPLAELLLAQAPAELDCTLSLGRSAVPLQRALVEVRASHQLELERASLRAGFGRGHLLELTLGVPGGNGAESEQNGAENLVRAVLGDRLFETWVGAVHVTPAPRAGSLRVLDPRAPRTSLQLRELFDTVAAATLGALRGLPASLADAEAQPFVAGPAPTAFAARTTAVARAASVAAREDWTLLEVEPLADARGVRKDDLVLASTCTPELLRCYLDGSPCASRRFSRSAEHFVFVSYVDDERSMQSRLARRSAIEAALADCVAGWGAVTGVGLGVKNTYVDLAVRDLETGLPRLVSKLQDVGAPAHTFIQFFDSELAEEWLSIWPDSRLPEG